jgi:aerobic carbon-monoxide dehydrogenase large subunit
VTREPGTLVGQPLRRREDPRFVRGRARYLDDLTLPGMVYAAFVRSPYASARILDVRAPEPTRGLLRVLTAADLAGRARPFAVRTVQGMQVADAPHPILTEAEVGYAGQPVAAVIADSREGAEDATALVEVDYEPHDPVVDPSQASVQLLRWAREAGDVDRAFATAPCVVRARHTIPRLVAAPIEPRGALAAYDRATDLLTVWASAQDPHRPLEQLAHSLDRAPERIHVVVPEVGGAFGSKGVLAVEAAVVACAAMELGRPVKWAEDRTENFLGAYQGRGLQAEVELALERDGRMLALRAHLLCDVGAYLLPTSPIAPHTTAMLMTGCYDIPAAEVTITGARTNKVPTGPYRGAGRPEAAYALERTVDAAARELGLDPVELRRRNLIRSFPHRTALGWTYDSGDYARCLELAVQLVEPEHHSDEKRLVGTGVAMYVERAGGLWESARVTIQADGHVIARSGSSPHGQGHETAFAQIIADRLGVPLEDIELRFGEPPGVGTFASRSVAVGGSALVLATEQVRTQAAPLAARMLAVHVGELTWGGGAFTAAGARAVTLAEIAATTSCRALDASVRYDAELVFGSGAYAAVVEIDRDTGALTVRRVAAVDDAGTVINPLLAEGQVLGGIMQGLGACLFEEAIYDEYGQLRTASFADYGLPTAAEQPQLVTSFVQTPSPNNPLGAKGIGEAGAIGTPAAIGNAVADALSGDAPDPPFTPEKIWRVLAKGGRSD